MPQLINALITGLFLFSNFVSASENSNFYRPYQTGDEDKAKVTPYLEVLNRFMPRQVVNGELKKWLSFESNRTEIQRDRRDVKLPELGPSSNFEIAKVAPPSEYLLSKLDGKIVILRPHFQLYGEKDPAFDDEATLFISNAGHKSILITRHGLESTFCGQRSLVYDVVKSVSIEGSPLLAIREKSTYCVAGDEKPEPDRYKWLFFSIEAGQSHNRGTLAGKALPFKLCLAADKKKVQVCK